MPTKDLVLAHLRKEKIKLWLPPYRNLPTQGGGSNQEALTKLAESVQKKNLATQTTTEEICNVLQELQNHAVQKLKEKNSLGIKILASKKHLEAFPKDKASDFFSSSSWGDEVTTCSSSRDDNDKTLHLRVVNLSPTLTVDGFSEDLCRALNARTVRVIWKGKNLLSSGSGNDSNGGGGADTTLRKIVMESNNPNDGTAGAGGKKKKNELLCLVSGYGYVPRPTPAVAAAATAAVAASDTTAAMAQLTVRTEAEIIQSIRRAAHTLQSSSGGGSRFEVTDQNGNLVPMRTSDTAAFLTALGLHRIGRSKMEKQRDGYDDFGIGGGDAAGADAMASSNDDKDEGGGGGRGRDDIASALVFLLEADAEWNTSSALDALRTKVDNYGLLQLDIAWCYLLLESLDDLADAVRRLDVAERVLRKQVHSNFVTLAVAQAEMEHAIPPLCSIFVRLFLLQGVANKLVQDQNNNNTNTNICNNSNATAKERMGWARLLCNRLRSTCPRDSVDAICNAYFVDPPTAIAALRRSNGDPDAAGNFIASDRDEDESAAKKRRRQRRIGRCENGSDFVDLDVVSALAGMLGFGDVAADIGNLDKSEVNNGNDDDNGRVVSLGENLHTSTTIVIGLLRLSNNDINRSLELYNSIGAEQILERVARLDEASGRRKRRSTKEKTPEHQVNDVDLAMLVSMGVEEGKCRDALKATGNVESALLWLSRDDDVNASMDTNTDDDVKAEAKTSGEEATSTNGDHKNEASNAENNDTHTSSASRDHSGSDHSDDSTSDSGEENQVDIDDAQALLERELGNVLGTGTSSSKQLLEKEWLGVDLQDEWDLIERNI